MGAAAFAAGTLLGKALIGKALDALEVGLATVRVLLISR